MLESVTANQCGGLTSVALQLPKTMPLKELSISGVAHVPSCCCLSLAESSGFTSKTVHPDNLHGCPGCPDLGKLVICSASVLSVNVSSNSSLSHLALNCAGLTSLMASQCYRLEQLQDGFSCPNLKVANFAGCKALQGDSSYCG